jgi:hypothetical protein
MANARRVTKVGLALATSANGTVRNGASLALNLTHPGTVIARCESRITTASVVATFQAQVSRDGTTWYDVKDAAQVATVNTAAGTGSEVITYRALVMPVAVHGMTYYRINATLSGAATAAADKTQVDYDYVQPGGLGL